MKINYENLHQAIAALEQCARENEKKQTDTGAVRVSDLCRDVATFLKSIPKPTDGALLIMNERNRQIEKEGFDAEHDKHESVEKIMAAAISYAIVDFDEREAEAWWPWDFKWWKPKTPQRNRERSGALMAAALDLMKKESEV